MPAWADQTPELPLAPMEDGDTGHLLHHSIMHVRPRPIFINIAERPYSADYNGGANAAPIYQDAADAIDAAGDGSVLYQPSGVYKFGRDGVAPDSGHPAFVEFGSGVTVKGDGPGLTTIMLADDPATSADFGPFRNKGRPIAGGGTGARNHHITFEGFTIDGNKGAETEFIPNRQGILMEGVDDVRVLNVEVKNVMTDAIVLAGCVRGWVTDCYTHDNLKAGLYFPASDHIHAKGCTSKNNGSPVAQIGAGIVLAASWFCTIVGCSGEGDIMGSIGLDRDVQLCTVEGNNFDHIIIAGNPISVAAGPVAGHITRPGAYVADGRYYYAYNNVIRGNTVRGTRTYPAIDISAGENNLVEGNHIVQANRDGVRILGGKGNIVRFNSIQDWGLAEVSAQQNAIRVGDAAALGPEPEHAAENNTVEGNVCRMNSAVANSAGIVVSTNGGPGISGTRVLRNLVSGADVPQYWLAGALSELEWTGAGSPEGLDYFYAPVGSIYHRTDGGAGTSLYVKESGTGKTGWVGK